MGFRRVLSSLDVILLMSAYIHKNIFWKSKVSFEKSKGQILEIKKLFQKSNGQILEIKKSFQKSN